MVGIDVISAKNHREDIQLVQNDIVLTAVFGSHAECLDRTFSSFAQHTQAELHALVVGETLPTQRVSGVQYHLLAPDPALAPGPWSYRNDAEREFQLLYRNVCYRRWEILDSLGAERCLVVDGTDVLCLQDLPPWKDLLRGAAVAASAEHIANYYLSGQGYTSNFLNAGVTFWDIPRSREIRQEILSRGRAEFRSPGDDQWVFNEVVQTRHYDDLIILPCQFNYRAYVGKRFPGWPTVSTLDGVRIYHNGDCIQEAVALGPVRKVAELPPNLSQIPPQPGTLRLRRPYRRVPNGTGRRAAPVPSN